MNAPAKIIITLFSIATVIAIIAGVYIHVLGGRGFSIRSKMVEDKVSLDGGLHKLSVDIDYADVTVQPGMEFSVAYALPESMVPIVTLENGTLEVKSPDNLVSLPWQAIGKHYVTITIPEKSELDMAIMKVDAGNQQIMGLISDKLDVHGDAGNVDIQNAQAMEISVHVDAGNIDLSGCTTDVLEAKADAGNLDISDCSIERIDADLDAGNVEAQNSRIESGDCKTSLGNILLSGEIGDVRAKSSVGKVSINSAP